MTERIWFPIKTAPPYIHELLKDVVPPRLGQSVYKTAAINKEVTVLFYFHPSQEATAVGFAMLPHPMVQLEADKL